MKFQSITLTIQHTCNIKNVKTYKIPYSLFHRWNRQGEVYLNKTYENQIKELINHQDNKNYGCRSQSAATLENALRIARLQ